MLLYRRRKAVNPVTVMDRALLKIYGQTDLSTVYCEANGVEASGASATVGVASRIFRSGNWIEHNIQSTDTQVAGGWRAEMTPANLNVPFTGQQAKVIVPRTPYVFGICTRLISWSMTGQDTAIFQFHNGGGDGDGAGANSSSLNLSLVSNQWQIMTRADSALVTGASSERLLVNYLAGITSDVDDYWYGEACFDWHVGGLGYHKWWRNGLQIVDDHGANSFNDSLWKFLKVGLYQWDAWSGNTTRTFRHKGFFLFPKTVGVTPNSLYQYMKSIV